MGFNSQSYYYAWNILCEKYDRSDVIVNVQFKKVHTHPPIWQDNSTSIVKFANVVTNVSNTLIQLGYTSELEAEAGLFAATEITVVAVYDRTSTTERQPDCFQRKTCLQSSNS